MFTIMLSHSGSHFKQGDNYAISSYIFFKDESHNCNICYPGDNTAEQLQKRGTDGLYGHCLRFRQQRILREGNCENHWKFVHSCKEAAF